jgi:cellulose biosynthesis protein BcsQ
VRGGKQGKTMKKNPRQTLSFVSSKGGAGKSSCAILLANYLAACGKSVLFIDTDYTDCGTLYYLQNRTALRGRSIAEGIRVKHLCTNIIATNHENIDIIPSNTDIENFEVHDKDVLRNLLEAESEELCVYDFIIIDTSQGYHSLITAAICASDIILTPVMLCQFDLMSGITLRAKIIEECGRYDHWHLFFNGVNQVLEKPNSSHYQYISLYKKTFPNCLDLFIPRSAMVANALDRSLLITKKSHERLHTAIYTMAGIVSNFEVPLIERF